MRGIVLSVGFRFVRNAINLIVFARWLVRRENLRVSEKRGNNASEAEVFPAAGACLCLRSVRSRTFAAIGGCYYT